MKQLLVLVLLIPFTVLAQKGEDKFVINAAIAGLPPKSVVTLTNVNNPTDTIARTEVINGGFVLKGSVSEPNLYQLNFHGIYKKAILFLSNDAISVKGDTAKINQLQITGSALQNDFIEFQNTFNPLFQKLYELNQKIGATTGIERTDPLMIEYTKHLENVKASIEQFATKKKSSPIGAFMLVVTSELEQDPIILERRFNLLDDKIKDGFYGKILRQQIDKNKVGAIGTEAIGFTQNDTAGNPVSLNSFRGKYVLVDFWASWCKPCRMENPNVVAAYNKFRDKNFTILGVSLDRAREPWLRAIKDDQLFWTQVSDLKYWQNEVAVKYNVEGIPQNFLISPEGTIIAKNLRGPELQAKLCELLGCN